jgi:hypothetical protein
MVSRPISSIVLTQPRETPATFRELIPYSADRQVPTAGHVTPVEKL